MMHLGDYPVNATVDFKWSTNAQDGASITRATDGTLRIYKANGIAERTSLSGVTQTEDFDTTTGVHHVRISLSDNTDAGFYAAGSEYQVVMHGMTIDTKVVNAVIAMFSIERTGGALALLKDMTTGLAALEALVDDLETRLGVPSNLGTGASIASNLVDIEAQTDDIGAAGVGLTAIPSVGTVGSVSAPVAVGTIAANAINAAALATDAVSEIQSGLSTLSAAQVGTEVDNSLADIGLSTTVTGRLDANVSSRATPAQVGTEIIDALTVDTYPEPAQGTPPATLSLAAKLGYLYKFLINRVSSSATTISVFNSAGTVVDHKSTHTDDGTTYDRPKFVSGP